MLRPRCCGLIEIHCNSPSQPKRRVRCPAIKPTMRFRSTQTKDTRGHNASLGYCSWVKYRRMRCRQLLLGSPIGGADLRHCRNIAAPSVPVAHLNHAPVLPSVRIN